MQPTVRDVVILLFFWRVGILPCLYVSLSPPSYSPLSPPLANQNTVPIGGVGQVFVNSPKEAPGQQEEGTVVAPW